MVDQGEIERTVLEKVAKILRITPESLSLDMRFKEDLKWRSMQAVKLAALIESAFGIRIPLDRAANNKTLGDSVRFIGELIVEQGR